METWIFKSIGSLSILISALASFPQLKKMYKSKQTKDVSFTSIIMFLIGTSLLNIYSFYFGLWEMFIPNVITFITLLLQIILKRYYDKRKNILDNEYLLKYQFESPINSYLPSPPNQTFSSSTTPLSISPKYN